MGGPVCLFCSLQIPILSDIQSAVDDVIKADLKSKIKEVRYFCQIYPFIHHSIHPTYPVQGLREAGSNSFIAHFFLIEKHCFDGELSISKVNDVKQTSMKKNLKRKFALN